MSRKTFKFYCYNIVGLIIGVFTFIISWIYILKFLIKSEIVITFLNEQIKNQRIIEDVIFVVSSIIPIFLFMVVVFLFREITKRQKQLKS